MRTLVSDMGGRSSVQLKARELGYDVSAGSEAVARAASRVKDLESRGYSFESADASFALLLREELAGSPQPAPFDVDEWEVAVCAKRDGRVGTQASVQLRVDGVPLVAQGRGNGPVHALDTALHKALDPLFPELGRLRLVDYRVRVLSGETGSSAAVRVLMSFEDGERRWGTVGVDANTVTAGWRALLDAAHYVLVGTPGRAPGSCDAPTLMASPAG